MLLLRDVGCCDCGCCFLLFVPSRLSARGSVLIAAAHAFCSASRVGVGDRLSSRSMPRMLLGLRARGARREGGGCCCCCGGASRGGRTRDMQRLRLRQANLRLRESEDESREGAAQAQTRAERGASAETAACRGRARESERGEGQGLAAGHQPRSASPSLTLQTRLQACEERYTSTALPWATR